MALFAFKFREAVHSHDASGLRVLAASCDTGSMSVGVLQLFDELWQDELHPNVVTYSALIDGIF